MRIAIAKQLSEKYGFDQTMISKKLGVTQAAVSKYLNGDYSNEFKELLKNQIVEEDGTQIAKQIAEEQISPQQLQTKFCSACQQFFLTDCLLKKS